jgi:hypothetical protein
MRRIADALELSTSEIREFTVGGYLAAKLARSERRVAAHLKQILEAPPRVKLRPSVTEPGPTLREILAKLERGG